MSGIDLKPDAQGKVRDLYDLGDKLLLELCTCLTRLGSLSEGFFALLIGQLWKGHGIPPIQ